MPCCTIVEYWLIVGTCECHSNSKLSQFILAVVTTLPLLGHKLMHSFIKLQPNFVKLNKHGQCQSEAGLLCVSKWLNTWQVWFSLRLSHHMYFYESRRCSIREIHSKGMLAFCRHNNLLCLLLCWCISYL